MPSIGPAVGSGGPIAPSLQDMLEHAAGTSPEDTLERLWELLPSGVRKASPEHWSAVKRLLPGNALSYYWEVPFTPGGNGYARDFLIQVPLNAPEPELRAGGIVADTAASLCRWYRGSNAAKSCYPAAWLELDDIAAGTADSRRPGISLCIDRSFDPLRPPGPHVRSISAATLNGILADLSSLFVQEGLDSTLANEIVAAWPATGWMRHVSLMASRQGSPRKLYGIVPKHDLEPFLCRIGWPGNVRDAVDLASHLYEDAPRVHVDLAFAGGLFPRLAFEFFSEPAPYEDYYRERQLGRAVGLGLLDDEGVQALKAWVGSTPIRLPDSPLPGVIFRWFDLKYVLDEGRLSLKAYLGTRIVSLGQ